MIELNDNLMAVFVPEYATNLTSFHFGTNHCIEWDKNGEYNTTKRIVKPFNRIVGVIKSNYEFDFDCEKYVEKVGDNSNIKYKLYGDFNSVLGCKTKEQSFMSLLHHNGIFLDELVNEKILILER